MLKTCSWRWIAVPLCLGLVACSSGSKPKPAKLTDISPKIAIQTAWTGRCRPAPRASVQARVPSRLRCPRVWWSPRIGKGWSMASRRPRAVWSGARPKGPLAAGVGTGGGSGEGSFAVVTVGGDLVLLDAKGDVRWRTPMGGVGLEKPVISGGHVVVRLADNRVAGWDLATGNRRWVFQRTLPTLRGCMASLACEACRPRMKPLRLN